MGEADHGQAPQNDAASASRQPDASRDTGTLGKLMRLLDLVSASDAPLRFSDILALTGEPRGTVHRQLSHLLEEGLLEQGRDQCYRPGLRLLMLASNAWSRNEFRAVAAPFLQELHEATGETVHLGVLHGREVVYLDKVESRQSVRMHSQIGRASPVHCTGIGKAALAALTPERAEALIARLDLRRFTPATLTDADALQQEVAAIRQQGHAFDREEHEAGIRCVAAPIGGGEGETGGVSVTVPAFRISEAALAEWAPLVRQIAARITRESTVRLGPRRGIEGSAP
jgi:DNA-binding IclR family transcriptional regulator